MFPKMFSSHGLPIANVRRAIYFSLGVFFIISKDFDFMTIESNYSTLSQLTQMRMLKLCNGFWYLLILGAAVLFTIVLVRWELYSHNWVSLVVYLGAPVLLILTSMGILKLVGEHQRMNLSLLAFSIVVSLLLIETYLAFFGHVDIRLMQALAIDVQFDHRSRK